LEGGGERRKEGEEGKEGGKRKEKMVVGRDRPGRLGAAAAVVRGDLSLALALLATSLFAGLGVSRLVISGVGFRSPASAGLGRLRRRRDFDHRGHLRRRQSCRRPGPARQAGRPFEIRPDQPQPDAARLQGDPGPAHFGPVRGRFLGQRRRSSRRHGQPFGQEIRSDISWTAQVVKADLFGTVGAVRIGVGGLDAAAGRHMDPRGARGYRRPDDRPDRPPGGPLIDNRATAEDHGLEYVEGARARHCRVAVDGATYLASFPQVEWLVGPANLESWRGELDYWVFATAKWGWCRARSTGPPRTYFRTVSRPQPGSS